MDNKKNNIYLLCLIAVCILYLCSCQRTQKHGNNNNIVDNDSVYVDKPFDSIVKGTPYEGMTEGEFDEEMKKGVYGDFTPEQVDSLEKALGIR